MCFCRSMAKSYQEIGNEDGSYLILLCQLFNSALNILNPVVTMRCELLGVIPARGSVRHYCCSGTYLLDVSHVQDWRKLENITRGYSDRCSYASPLRICPILFNHKTIARVTDAFLLNTTRKIIPIANTDAVSRFMTLVSGNIIR